MSHAYKVGDRIVIKKHGSAAAFGDMTGRIRKHLPSSKNIAAGPLYSLKLDKYEKPMGFYESEFDVEPATVEELVNNYEVD